MGAYDRRDHAVLGEASYCDEVGLLPDGELLMIDTWLSHLMPPPGSR